MDYHLSDCSWEGLAEQPVISSWDQLLAYCRIALGREPLTKARDLLGRAFFASVDTLDGEFWGHDITVALHGVW